MVLIVWWRGRCLCPGMVGSALDDAEKRMAAEANGQHRWEALDEGKRTSVVLGNEVSEEVSPLRRHVA